MSLITTLSIHYKNQVIIELLLKHHTIEDH